MGQAVRYDGFLAHFAFTGHSGKYSDTVQSVSPALRVTVTLPVDAICGGQVNAIGGGGLHVGTAPPGVWGLGQFTGIAARHVSPAFVTVQVAACVGRFDGGFGAGSEVGVGGGGFPVGGLPPPPVVGVGHVGSGVWPVGGFCVGGFCVGGLDGVAGSVPGGLCVGGR